MKTFLIVISKGNIVLTSITLVLSILIAVSVTVNATDSVFLQKQATSPTITFFNSEGFQAEKIVVSGRPLEFEEAKASTTEPDITIGINILPNVPDFKWSYGCSATSAAMLFGYYDRPGYSNMYTGPTDEGVCPLKSVWGITDYGGSISYECPLSASHQDKDGRTSRGHVDDYWIGFENAGPDPYIISGWVEHTPEDCTGDFMGTNQSSYGNLDGAAFFFFNTDGSAIYDYILEEPTQRDGCHGMRLFAESQGYSVVTNFSQKIQGEGTNQNLGFTFEDFQAEIDAGRPVLIHVKGPEQVHPTYHVMLGYGYNTTGSLVYLHDTFSDGTCTMTWGSTYLGMKHYGVTVIQLADLTPPSVNTSLATNISADSATLNGSLDNLGSHSKITVSFEWGTVSGTLDHETTPELMTSTGIFTAVVGNLTPNTIYYFRAKATGDISAYGPELSCTFDNINPTITITGIKDFVNDLDAVAGTASDIAPGEIQKVQMVLKNTTKSTYWNGSDWTSIETRLEVSGTSFWNYTLPALGDSQTYQVKAISMDTAENESIGAIETFLFDTTSPSVTITGASDCTNHLTSISGTASDTLPGALLKVQVMLKNTTTNIYWDGASWENAQIWIDTSGSTSWTYALPALIDGQTYQVKARSIDMAANESICAIATFLCDTTSPSITITSVGNFTNDLTSISGTASDISPGELQKVEIVLNNLTNSSYWNGGDWVSTETWLEASGTASWSYALPVMQHGQTYQVKAKSIDMAGNESTGISFTFLHDTINPTVTVTSVDDFANILDTISGTASDISPGKLQKVEIVLKNTTDHTYWNGSDWVSTETWLKASGTTSWSFALPALTEGKDYQIKARSIDMAGNESITYRDAFTYETDIGGHTFNDWVIVVVILGSVTSIGLVFLFRFVKHTI